MYYDFDRDYEDALTKKERPTQHTRLTTKLQAEDPVVSLQQPDSEAAIVFRGNTKAPMQLWTMKGCVPDRAAKANPTWYLHFRVMGSIVARRICIDVSVPGSRPRIGHVKKLEFFVGLGQVQEFQYAETKQCDLESPGNDYWQVSFRTSGGTSTGLDIVDPKEDAAARSGLQALVDLEVEQVKRTSKGTRLVFLSIRNPEKAVDAHRLQIMVWSLAHPEAYEVPPWHPYLRIPGMPSVEHMNLQDRKIVRTRSTGRLIRYPALVTFANSREASVVLRYGTLLEYRAAPHHGLRGSWQVPGDEDIWVRQMLSGLEKLFGPSSALTRPWIPYFLTQKAGTSSQEVVSSQGQSLDKHIAKALPWSTDQVEVFDRIHKATSRINIVEGAPGSGRSTLLAAVAVTYALRGTAIALMSSCSASSKALAATTRKMLSYLPTSLQQKINFLSHYDEANVSNVREESLAKVDILVTTPNVVCAKSYRSGFGSFSNNIMILHDDANLLMEPEIIATLFGLDNVAKVTDLIMVTDTYQWRPSVVTEVAGSSKCVTEDHSHTHYTYGWYWSFYEAIQKGDTELCKKIKVGVEKNQAWEKKSKKNCFMKYSGGTNEFADQLALSLPLRLLRQGFPSLQLTTQHRMGEDLVAMPRERVYGDNIAAALPRKIDPEVAQFRDLLKEWLGDECPVVAATIFLEAGDKHNAECVKERNTTESKRNHRFAAVIYDLLLQNHKAKAIDKSKIKVVTPYGDQQRLHQEVARVQHKTYGKPAPEELPAVLSLDSMRNKESAVIIYDLTVTCGDKSHGTGIVSDEMRTNIALTRASDILIVVGSKELTGVFPGFWNFWCNERGLKHEPLPYIVEFAVKMKEKGLYFVPKIKTPLPYVSFDVNPAWHKEFNSHLDWEYDRNQMADQGDREDDMN